MQQFLALSLSLIFFLTACSGTDSVTRKSWSEHKNTIYLQDLTSNKNDFQDAGDQLRLALEDQFADTLFLVAEEKKHARFQMKYKVTEFNKGSRLKRMATFGIDDGSRARIKVKVALFSEEGILGQWEVESWVGGGITGGSASQLFEQVAEQILQHLKGF